MKNKIKKFLLNDIRFKAYYIADLILAFFIGIFAPTFGKAFFAVFISSFSACIYEIICLYIKKKEDKKNNEKD